MVVKGLISNGDDRMNGTGHRVFVRKFRIVADDIALPLSHIQRATPTQCRPQAPGSVATTQSEQDAVTGLVGHIAPGSDNLTSYVTKLAEAEGTGTPAQSRADAIDLKRLLVGARRRFSRIDRLLTYRSAGIQYKGIGDRFGIEKCGETDIRVKSLILSGRLLTEGKAPVGGKGGATGVAAQSPAGGDACDPARLLGLIGIEIDVGRIFLADR